MKLQINAAAFAAGLGMATRAISARSFLPVLECVRFDAKEDGRVIFTGTDGHIFIQKTIQSFPTMFPVSVLLPKTLVGAIGSARSADGQYAEIELLTPQKLRVKSGPLNMTVALPQEADDFPAFPEDPAGTEPAWKANVESGTFRQAVAKTAFAANTTSYVPVYTNVHCKVGNGGITLEATDNYKLVVATLPADTTGEANVLVPAKQLMDAIKLLPPGEKNVKLTATNNAMVIEEGDTEEPVRIAIRTSSEKFPNVASILAAAREGVVEMTIPWMDVVGAITRATTFSSNKAVTIKPVYADGISVRVSVTTETGTFEEDVMLPVTEEPVEIADTGITGICVAPGIVLPVLKAARDEQIVIAVKPNGTRSPILIAHPSNPSWQALVMPVTKGE